MTLLYRQPITTMHTGDEEKHHEAPNRSPTPHTLLLCLRVPAYLRARETLAAQALAAGGNYRSPTREQELQRDAHTP